MNEALTAIKDRPDRPPVPDEFFCGKPVIDPVGPTRTCDGIPTAKIPDMAVWLRENRPNLQVNLTKLTCTHDLQAQAQVVRNERREEAANLPARRDQIGPRTFFNFEAKTPELKAIVGELQDFAKKPTTHMLTIGGPVGTGKTHLVEATARLLLGHGVSVRYEFVPQLLRELQDAFNDPGASKIRMDLLRDARVLILDDVGQRVETEWARSVLNDLIDERYRNGTGLLVVTNHPKKQLAEKVGDRIASRLWDNTIGTAKVLRLAKTTSYRDRRKTGKGKV